MSASSQSTTRLSLQKTGHVPLYVQIQQHLMEKIQRGKLIEGDLLQGEEELSRQFGVSRMTARQALNGLKAQGYAVSERGRGTFVSKPKFTKSILMLEGFTEEIRKKGDIPTSKLLLQEVVLPTESIAAELRVPSHEFVFHLRRLRLVNDEPLAIEDSYLVLSRFPGIDKIDFSRTSLYESIRNMYGTQFGWADEIIEAISATSVESDLLTVPAGASLLSIRRTLIASDQAPIEYAISHYRGDRYHASLRVQMDVVRGA